MAKRKQPEIPQKRRRALRQWAAHRALYFLPDGRREARSVLALAMKLFEAGAATGLRAKLLRLAGRQ